MSVPIVKGKKINRVLFLVFLACTAALLAAAGLSAAAGKPELSSVFLILAMINGGFALLYGMLWLIWSRREKKAEAAMREAAARYAVPADPARMSSREFILPKEELTAAAFRRWLGVVKGCGIAALIVFLLIAGLLYFNDSLDGPLHLLYILLFCLLTTVPGLLIQRGIYRKYERSVPRQIVLFPGKLVVDDAVFSAREISAVRISSAQLVNLNSPAVFREMTVRAAGGSATYRLDYRAGNSANGQPFWKEYPLFAAALSDWGTENEVPVEVAYMD